MSYRNLSKLLIGSLLFSMTALSSSCMKTACDNTCYYAYDGECDDGGRNSLTSLCDCGTDCYDCGSRNKGIGPGSSCK